MAGCSGRMLAVDAVRGKYERLRGVMDERVTRLRAAAEAEALGYGGIAVVVEARGISKSRVRAGSWTWRNTRSTHRRFRRVRNEFGALGLGDLA